MAYSFNTPQPRRLWRRTALAAVLMAGTALGGFAVGHVSFAATDATPGAPVNPPGSNPTGGQVLPDFTNLVGQVKPAVVSITTTLRIAAS
jgi:serine protease Do